MKTIAVGLVTIVVVWLLFTVVFPRIDAMIDDPAMEPPTDERD